MSRRLGEYVPLSVDYADDDAVMACTPLAELLYVRCLTLARRLRSDGYLTEAQLVHRAATRLGGPRRARVLADELVTVGLLERLDGGYVIRAWLKWNKSADELGRELARDRDRKRAERASPEDVRTDTARTPGGIQTESGSVPQDSGGCPPSRARARAPAVPDRTVPDLTEPQPPELQAVNGHLEGTPGRIELPTGPWLNGAERDLPPIAAGLEAERRRQHDELMRLYPEVSP